MKVYGDTTKIFLAAITDPNLLQNVMWKFSVFSIQLKNQQDDDLYFQFIKLVVKNKKIPLINFSAPALES